MKNHDLFLMGGRIESGLRIGDSGALTIRLGDSGAECGLIIDSIIFRDAVSANFDLVLDTDQAAVTLLKYIAERDGVALELGGGLVLPISILMVSGQDGLELDFNAASTAVKYLSAFSSNELELGNSSMRASLIYPNHGESVLEIGTLPADAVMSAQALPAESAIEIVMSAPAVSQTVIMELQSGVDLELSVLPATLIKPVEGQTGIEIGSGGKLTAIKPVSGVGAVLEFAMSPVDGLVQTPLGNGQLVLEVGPKLATGGIRSKKSLEVNSTMEIGLAIQSCAIDNQPPEDFSLEIGTSGSAVVGRMRLLSDMDGHSISEYDDIPMSEVDWLFFE